MFSGNLVFGLLYFFISSEYSYGYAAAFSEKIFGAIDRKDKTYTSELDQIILSAGKIPVQRDTFYNIIRYT